MPDLDNPAFQNQIGAIGSENALFDLPEATGSSSENTKRRTAGPRPLSAPLEAVLADYNVLLTNTPLAGDTPRVYSSQVRGFLAWLDGDGRTEIALADPHARDGAVRDYRAHLQTVLRRRPATINLALAAINDFYLRRGLGAPVVARLALPPTAPRALSPAENTRWLREVERRPARDRVLAYLGRYAGLRIGERVALDGGDIALSARKCVITVRKGKGGRYREIPAHPLLREELSNWIYEERPRWTGAESSDALLLNARGARLGTRGADKILAGIAATAGIEDGYTSHVDRHSFATELLRERGADIVLVAELLGHARLEDTRRYTLPTADDKAAAVAGLAIDR